MPIDKSEWDQGRTGDTVEGRITGFLKSNRGKAFNSGEIIDSFGYNLSMDSVRSTVWTLIVVWGILNALENLVRRGEVKAKIIKTTSGSETYYMA